MNFPTELREGLLIAFEAIRANKLRSSLTTLGIVIGIVTVTLMGTAIEGLNAAFIRSISAMGADVLFVSKFAWFSDEPWWKVRNRRDILMQDARVLRAQQRLAEAVSIESGTRKPVRYLDHIATGVNIMGNNEDGAATSGITLQDGRWFTGAEVEGARPVCVLGSEISANFFPFEAPVGKHVRIDESSYEVIGVVEKRGKFLGMESLDNQVFVPITRFAAEHRVRPDVFIRVKVRNVKELDEAREELRGIVRKVRRLEPGADDDFAINAQEAIVKMFGRVSRTIATVGLFITGLSLAVGGIGIIAWPLSLVMNQFLPVTMSVTVVSLALGVSAFTGVVAGFLPAWRAARMNPVDALRNE
ncbi:MAG: ABC transporter permease [Verrucomicrobia bacterium]|nr:ABC transporter permease [Verrucomicrobiota bacterium]